MTFPERQEVDDLISADFPLELSHLILESSHSLFSSYDDTTVSTCPRTVGNCLPFESNGIEFSGQMELHFFFH